MVASAVTQGIESVLTSAASPRKGRSVAGAVAPLSIHVHAAVAELLRGERLPASPWLTSGAVRDQVAFDDQRARAAWSTVAITIMEAIATSAAPSTARALTWFGGSQATDQPASWEKADVALAGLAGNAEVCELFPYLLDVFGRTSRLDVMRDESLGANRTARKDLGSFYTPADVARFMVGSIDDEGARDARWFDPATGSAVFLLAALNAAWERLGGPAGRMAFATNRLLGTDISPQACDFAAFAIIQRLGPEGRPADAWVKVRRNIIAADAIALMRRRGREGMLQAAFGWIDGPLRLVCNPPYVASSSPATITGGGPFEAATKSLYLPFIEMAWRVAVGKGDAAALVVPLAFAANRTMDHRRCRTALAAAGGDWTMLFFDRQPHALFGEEAKTRTSILIRRPGPLPAKVATSNLLKWTSRQRQTIFSEARATPLVGAGIGRLVPKVGSELEARLYANLTTYRLRRTGRPSIGKAKPSEIVGTSLSNDVMIGGTAYNFLNVFRNYPDVLSWRGTLSASGVHLLGCGNASEADRTTAILASRVAFWLWHVECDGFHVPAWFLEELPLLEMEFPVEEAERLAALGREAWVGAQRDILTSLNRDKVTFAFRPTHIGDVRTEIDRIVLGRTGFGEDAVAAMRAFEHRIVSIDGERRIAKDAPGIAMTKIRKESP